MELTESLLNLGLNEKEASVYLALLGLERATAYTIGIRSKLKNATAYVVLDNLVSKGFALKIPQADKHYFIAKSPRECIAIAQEKLSATKEMLPELLAIQKKADEKVSVAYFEGFEGIKKMYDQLIAKMQKKPLPERSFIAFYAHQKHTPNFLQEYWLQLNDDYAKNNIKRTAITTLHPSIKNYLAAETKKKLKMDLRTLIEKDYSSNISLEVYDNFTQIISHRYLQGILIENPDIADVMQQIFKLVWKTTNQQK